MLKNSFIWACQVHIQFVKGNSPLRKKPLQGGWTALQNTETDLWHHHLTVHEEDPLNKADQKHSLMISSFSLQWTLVWIFQKMSGKFKVCFSQLLLRYSVFIRGTSKLQVWNVIAKFVVLHCEFCKLRRNLGFFCSVNHLSGPLRKHMFTCDCCILIHFVCFCVSRFAACDPLFRAMIN